MMTSPDSGRVLLVHDKSFGGITHKHRDVNPHEAEVWMEVIGLCVDSLHEFGPTAEACGWLRREASDASYVTMSVVSVPNLSLLENMPGEFTYHTEDAMAVYNAIDSGDCLGLWHSHPSGNVEPSDDDWLGQPRGVPMFIIGIDQDEKQAMVVEYTDADRP